MCDDTVCCVLRALTSRQGAAISLSLVPASTGPRNVKPAVFVTRCLDLGLVSTNMPSVCCTSLQGQVDAMMNAAASHGRAEGVPENQNKVGGCVLLFLRC